MHSHFQILLRAHLGLFIWDGVLYFRILLHFNDPIFQSILRGYMRRPHTFPPPECIYDKNVLVLPDNRWEPFFHRETKRSRWQACFDRWWVQWTTCPHILSKQIWCRTCHKKPVFDRVHSIGLASPTIKKKVHSEFWIVTWQILSAKYITYKRKG